MITFKREWFKLALYVAIFLTLGINISAFAQSMNPLHLITPCLAAFTGILLTMKSEHVILSIRLWALVEVTASLILSGLLFLNEVIFKGNGLSDEDFWAVAVSLLVVVVGTAAFLYAPDYIIVHETPAEHDDRQDRGHETGVRNGFSLTELMIVLVIIGVLVLLSMPRLTPVVSKAKTTEAKLQLKQLFMLEQSFKFERDRYSQVLADIGFEQEALVSEGGQARYQIRITSSDTKAFLAEATSVVDFDDDGIFNVWTVDQTGVIKEAVPD